MIQVLAVAIFVILTSVCMQAMDRLPHHQTRVGYSVFQPEFQAGMPERVSLDWRNLQQEVELAVAQLAYKKQTDPERFDDLPTSVSALTLEDRNRVDGFMHKLSTDCHDSISRERILNNHYVQYRNTMAKAVMLGKKCPEFLEVAVKSDDRKLVAHLLVCGADAQQTQIFGRPIIHLAKTAPIAELLLQYGAPITAADISTNYTLLHEACCCSNSFELLACYINEFKKRHLLEKYINNQANVSHVAPIHHLILSAVNHQSGFKGCFPQVQKKLTLLLENGADCLLKTWLGETPQDAINSIIANPDIYREEGTHPYWAQISAQLAAATEAQLKGKAERLSEILKKESLCAICLDEFEQPESCIVLPCAHAFHTTCIQPWINEHANCPTCRANAPVQNNNNSNQVRNRSNHDRSDILPRWNL